VRVTANGTPRRASTALQKPQFSSRLRAQSDFGRSGRSLRDVFVHISAVERAGLSSLNEGQVVEYEVVTNRGKTSAENLKIA
jgi:CspA family cold shock protein